MVNIPPFIKIDDASEWHDMGSASTWDAAYDIAEQSDAYRHGDYEIIEHDISDDDPDNDTIDDGKYGTEHFEEEDE